MELIELPPVPAVVLYLLLPVLGFALFLARCRYPKFYGAAEIAVAFLLVRISVRTLGGFTIGVSAIGGPDGLGPLRATVGTATFLGAVFVFIRGLEKLVQGWHGLPNRPS